MSIDFTTDIGKVRLLLNDVDTPSKQVFTDVELQAFLTLEGGDVKLAAAQAIDANATNVALATRVLRTQDLSTDGAKLADAMRKQAAALRAQVVDSDDYVEVIPGTRSYRWPELTNRPAECGPVWPFC